MHGQGGKNGSQIPEVHLSKVGLFLMALVSADAKSVAPWELCIPIGLLSLLLLLGVIG